MSESGVGVRTDRRTVLRGLAACGCAGAASGLLAAEAGAAPWRIDIHHHFASPAYDRFIAANPRSGIPPAPHGGLAASLADMDRGGTQLAVLSSFVPATGGTAQDRQALARGINEFAADAARKDPARFAFFAVLPLPDVDASLRELAHGLDVLAAVGATVYTEAAGLYLGDPAYRPLMEELDRRRAVLFVHPNSDSCCQGRVKGVGDAVIEFGTSTTRTIASLLFSGAADRHPNIRFIFSHGGGTMPFLIERFLAGTRAEIVPGITTTGQTSYPLPQPREGALATLRRFHYDTAQIANPVSLRALSQVVPPSQILYGTDYWFRSSDESARQLDAARVFSLRQRRQIGRDNAASLIPALLRA